MADKDIRALFLAHRRELQAYLTRKVRDGETAAELTQEAFLRYAQQGPGAAAVVHPRSYLYRTAHNLAVDHVRRQRRERTDPVPVDDMEGVADERPSPERVAGGLSDVAAARDALLELPERTRQVFVLTRIDGLTYGDVARRLQISDSSVQKHLARAVKHVMQRLRGRQAGSLE
ncbi:MAG: RNA polymerase sigma factor [Reyranella sp.]|uniref:RNA polymerase sigma factor n=1 Tax=Reyranella sp. TaxID=1929291 RepID=UPI00120FA9EC|nr:RNA polymerase sigma factor [Reyranella sp.]TAJ87213.1 MAG: RNA polymerase sigma factor [Reyranella sp.]TBR26174.1 MAG: RNA polymerase sigma factor [Reyranella sp.]